MKGNTDYQRMKCCRMKNNDDWQWIEWQKKEIVDSWLKEQLSCLYNDESIHHSSSQTRKDWMEQCDKESEWL